MEGDSEGRFEPVIGDSRHVLGETAEHFEIRARGDAGTVIERFPLTPQGFAEAEARFRQLRWESRRAWWGNRDLRRLLLIVLWVGVGAWIAGGILTAVTFLWVRSGFWNDVAFVLSVVSFPLALGPLFLLIALAMSRLLRRVPPTEIVTPGWPTGGLAPPLVAAIVVGLVVWVAASLTAHLLEPGGSIVVAPGFPGGLNGGPSPAYRVASAVESLASHVWVAATVGFLLLWIRGGGRGREAPGRYHDEGR